VDNATTEINVNDHKSVAEHLIMQPAEAPVEQTSDEAVVQETMSDDQIDQPEQITEDYEQAEPEVYDEPQERVFNVKVNGEMREVTEQELTRDYSGQQYIQQQMREVAEQRKAVEQAKLEAHETSNAYAQALAQVNERLQTDDLTPPDKSMRETDPIGYLEAMEDFRAAQAERQTLQQQQYLLQQQQQAQQSAQRDQYVQQEAANLMERIPILKDPVKGPETISAMMKTGAKYGFSEAEMKNEADPRFVSALHALHQFESRGNVDTAEMKRGAIKPGARRSQSTSQAKQAQAARSQMKRTGSTQDVAAWIMNTGK
tara:strand:- start:84 stop:1028 length:945 start_codon:yes stop_codon:yes gene_type:complete